MASVLFFLLSLTPLSSGFRLRRPFVPSPADECGGHLCSGFAWYPVVAAGFPVGFSATFNVPKLPAAIDVSDPSFCHYIYFNIFFPNFKPAGAVYNQFVPQLVLGNALTGSSGAPRYAPAWGNYSSWFFSAQYFFALNSTGQPGPELHAATGPVFPAAAGEVLWTRMIFDAGALSWRLSMGVVGDRTRISVVDVPKPFMGLLDPAATWADEAFSFVHVNSCWELYGIVTPGNWPSSGSNYVMEVRVEQPGAMPWAIDWGNGSEMDCPGRPTNVSWSETHNGTLQRVGWNVEWNR